MPCPTEVALATTGTQEADYLDKPSDKVERRVISGENSYLSGSAEERTEWSGEGRVVTQIAQMTQILGFRKHRKIRKGRKELEQKQEKLLPRV